jgi:uncharacterized membrane protein
MDDARDTNEPRSAGSDFRVGGGAGCLAAFLFALPIGFIVLFAGAMAECGPGSGCGDKRMFIARNLAVVLALAALFGLSIRVLVRRSRLRGTAAAPRAWAVALAFPFVVVVGLFLAWLALASFGVIAF